MRFLSFLLSLLICINSFAENGIQNLTDAAKVFSGFTPSVVDVEEIDRKINAFALLVGEEQFNLIVGGTLLSKSALGIYLLLPQR